jgi:hypothetical protein
MNTTLILSDHGTEEDFARIRPYLDRCNVVSIEQACSSTEEAQEFEEMILAYQQGRKDPKAFLQNTKESDYSGFLLAFDRYLIEEKKPLVLVEKFEKPPTKELNKGHISNMYFGYVQRHAVTSCLTNFLQDFKSHWQVMRNLSDLRDKNIGNNLKSVVLDRIRELHPDLSEIHYGISVGRAHQPEKYFDFDNIVNLEPREYHFINSFFTAPEVTDRMIADLYLASVLHTSRQETMSHEHAASIVQNAQIDIGSIDDLSQRLLPLTQETDCQKYCQFLIEISGFFEQNDMKEVEDYKLGEIILPLFYNLEILRETVTNKRRSWMEYTTNL